MAENTVNTVTERSYGLHFWSLSLSVLLIVVVTIILITVYLADGKAAVLLGVFIPLLVVTGVVIALLWRRQRQTVIVRQRSGPQEVTTVPPADPQEPTAPPASARSSWRPWRRMSNSSSSHSWMIWRKTQYNDVPTSPPSSA
ncbi:uncharacterized protein LOC126198744 [Schistocerca nitens]|uniref:uncharacterized protein LOC126095278 n=1 Tax=Schistocerca cancellata TaxID=274614 RepID=UPI002118F45A|nr:uncharacterized protein LOC126095278 [Schistocerca cancellata]XP_049791251.1 uncharacterized protein LOC126198744 [Schistocerca nitens]